MNELTCQHVRELAFDYRRHDLGETDRALIDDHAAGCPECGAYLANLEALLGAARAAAAPLPASAVDRLWDRLEAQLPQAAQAAVEVASTAEAPPPSGTRGGSLTRWHPRAVAVVAAVAALLVLGLLWAPWRATPPSDPQPVALAPPAPATLARPTPRAEPPPEVAPPPDAAPRLLPERHPHPGLSIWAGEGARWSFSEADRELLLEVTAGFLVVEALPRSGERLVVSTPRRRFEVVGTVFLVDADTPRIAVFAGSVRVDAGAGGTLALDEGFELGASGEIAPLDPDLLGLVSSHVDLTGHRARLPAEPPPSAPAEPISSAARVTEPTRAEEPTSSVARVRAPSAPAEPAPTPVRAPSPEDGVELSRPSDVPAASLATAEPRRSSRRALPELAPTPLALSERAEREGRYAEAAALLEGALEAGALTDDDAALARLELARLYETRLAQPARALRHLRAFLDSRSADPAAASVRRELCRLLDRLDLVDDTCEP